MIHVRTTCEFFSVKYCEQGNGTREFTPPNVRVTHMLAYLWAVLYFDYNAQYKTTLF